MERIFTAVAMLFFVASCAPVYAADCRKSLFEGEDAVFRHEGGYQNSKKDTGNFRKDKAGHLVNCGGTKYGISCRDHPGIDIPNLDKAGAARIYEKNECAELRFAELEGQKIPTKMLNLAVNMGTGTAVKLIIRTINRLNGIEADLPEKPVMTPEIVSWYNHYTENRDQRSVFYLVLILEALDRYSDIVESNPKQAAWLLGWIIRLNPYSD